MDDALAREKNEGEDVESVPHFFLGDVLRTVFDELKAAGFKVPLVEDHIERRIRFSDDDPWWIDRGPRLNSPGR